MKKAITITALTLIGLFILFKTGFMTAFLFFLLVGAVPGTAYSIPSSVMLLAIAAIAFIVLFRFIAVEAFYTHISNRTAKHHDEHKKRLPRRRFSEI